jgi:transposase InsO family protein
METFSRFGTPETIVSDNGTPFTSHDFAEFCAESHIEHIFTAPYHPASNGEIERFFRTFKQSVPDEKASAKSNLSKFLATFRQRKTPDLNSSPAQLLLAYAPQSTLTRTYAALVKHSPAPHLYDDIDNRFAEGTAVWFRSHSADQPKWLPGVIVRVSAQIVLVTLQHSRLTFRRHVNHVKLRHERPYGSDPPRDTDLRAPMPHRDLPTPPPLPQPAPVPQPPLPPPAPVQRPPLPAPLQPGQQPAARRYPGRLRQPPLRYCVEFAGC